MKLSKGFVKNLKLISITSFMLFSLFSTVTATVCWFRADKKMSMPITSVAITNESNIKLAHKVYKFNNTTKIGYEVNQGQYIEGDLDLTLDSYDKYFEYRNEYLSQIIEFKIDIATPTSAMCNINFKVNRNQPFLEANSTDYVGAYMSNVVRFKSCLYQYKVGSTTNKVFTMGTTNIYKKSIDGENYAYANNNNQDQTYQEIRNRLLKDGNTYENSSFFSSTTISSLPTRPTTINADYRNKLATINSGKLSSISFNTKAEVKNTPMTLPEGTTSAIIYVLVDYQEDLTKFFAVNKNPNLTGVVSLTPDFGSIDVSIVY